MVCRESFASRDKDPLSSKGEVNRSDSGASSSLQSLVSDDRGRRVREARAKHVLLWTAALTAGLASAGCSKATVPNVVGQEIEQAKQSLAAAKLKPGNISGNQAAGAYVVLQTPNAYQQIATNSPVDLQVETPMPVPDLTHLKVTDAVSMLQQMGLKVAFVKQPTMKLFGGPKVAAQSPAAQTPVRRDATVTITVATPPDLGAFLGIITQEPEYQNLKPEYKNALDQVFGPSNAQKTGP